MKVLLSLILLVMFINARAIGIPQTINNRVAKFPPPPSYKGFELVIYTVLRIKG